MKVFEFLILICSVFLITCQPEPGLSKQNKNEVKVPKQVDSSLSVSADDNIITNQNVIKRLTEYGLKNPETLALIKTDKGDIRVKLYRDTPLHRANFILMAKNGCFNQTVFTRVSKGFMAQGGGTYDEKTVSKRNSIGRYTIPAEIRPHYFHKAGALAMARSYNDNPEKKSSPFDFYLVEGSVFNEATLDKYEETNNYKYPVERRRYYLKNPGAAHIDGEHTIFGEVVEGISVIPHLTNVKTDSRDWPVTDIYIREVIILE